ncbi:hypothetical protein GCK72_013114 [Caenorhabditis remanei]|uniref:Uncharacterized protein n=1 Tax=Caenorhabditis remanei TaxID=31234 RepID=A0A6A5GN23_CAERE|nr:hypothetical protein GCK72_013114 [Caenorhabditis remanei]KAF1756660.1 hypothetical protein GCK72_013114 [Caenorhabditis remanei]
MGITTSKSENLTTDESKKRSGREKKNDEVVTRNVGGVVFNIVAGANVTISKNNTNFTSSMQEPGKLTWSAKRARRIAHFDALKFRIEKGKHLRKLEANVKKSGGKRVTFKRDVEQKMEVKVKMEQSKHVKTESSELMN